MLGRGALCRPDLPRLVAGTTAGETPQSLQWPEVLPLLLQFFALNLAHYDARYAPNPLKQWLVYLRGYYLQAAELFETVKRMRDPAQVQSALVAALSEACPGQTAQGPALITVAAQ
jgi:tRNA-dihydrouridine synthase C